MPFDVQPLQLLHLGQGFLQVVFAEQTLSLLPGGFDICSGTGFADGQQGDGSGVATTLRGRGGNALSYGLEGKGQVGHILDKMCMEYTIQNGAAGLQARITNNQPREGRLGVWIGLPNAD